LRWVTAVTACAFGPYLAGGFRTEQVAVYLSALLVVLFGWRAVFARGTSAPLPFLTLWGAYLFAAFLGVAGHSNDTPFESGSLLAGIDNLLLPLAMLLLTWYWRARDPGWDALKAAARVIVTAMTANAVIAMYSVAAHSLQPFSWLPQFWNREQGGASVAVNSIGNGRYTGIFNQPAEAGVAYSLAVFCLLYLTQTGGARGRPRAFAGAALVVGGVLTVSKMFLLGGLPVVAWLVLRDRHRRVRIVGGTAMFTVAYRVLSTSHLLPHWAGTRQLGDLFGGGSLLSRLTAQRFGSGSTLSAGFATILHSSPLTGVGAAGLKVPYDSAWLEAMIVAGIAGVVLLGLTQLWLVARWWTLRGVTPAPEHRLAGAALILVVASSLGLPTLTANRVSTLCWLILGLTVTSRSPEHEKDRPAPHDSLRNGGTWGLSRVRDGTELEKVRAGFLGQPLDDGIPGAAGTTSATSAGTGSATAATAAARTGVRGGG
jgi:hypothetical protein